MHPEAITSEQNEVLKKLPIPPNFYLVGGTALALQIGHRISVDFDFFNSEKIPPNLFSRIEKIFRGKAVTIRTNVSFQLTLKIGEVDVTYFRYPFPPILPLVPYGKLNLLSIPEIAASKAHAMGRRATRKDYVDLYFIFKEKHTTLPQVIEIAQRKYKEEFDTRLFLEQLGYLDDVPDAEIVFLRGEVDNETIKDFFDEERKKVKLL